MSDNPTREEVLASIVAKSDQLNAEDLITGPVTATITGVKRGSKEQPIIVEIDGHQPYKPCKTMRRVLIATFSDDPKLWIGQRMTLFCDPTVLYAGVRVGGIRISHLSGIEKPQTFLLTKSRGKKAEVVILPIEASSPAVTQERLDWLKVGWAKKHADILGKDKDENSRLFGEWVQQTLGGNFNPGGEQDANKKTSWSINAMEQCEKALE